MVLNLSFLYFFKKYSTSLHPIFPFTPSIFRILKEKCFTHAFEHFPPFTVLYLAHKSEWKFVTDVLLMMETLSVCIFERKRDGINLHHQRRGDFKISLCNCSLMFAQWSVRVSDVHKKNLLGFDLNLFLMVLKCCS